MMTRVGQSRIYTPYMTVCMVISLLKYRMYIVYTYKYVVLAHPNDGMIAVMQEEASMIAVSYRLSSHARLEAFVIQTKLNCDCCDAGGGATRLCYKCFMT